MRFCQEEQFCLPDRATILGQIRHGVGEELLHIFFLLRYMFTLEWIYNFVFLKYHKYEYKSMFWVFANAYSVAEISNQFRFKQSHASWNITFSSVYVFPFYIVTMKSA